MKSINQYISESLNIYESNSNDFVKIESGVNPRKDQRHLKLEKMFPEKLEGWKKIYHEECCHKSSRHGNYNIIVGHLNNGKYAVKYRITDNIVEYPKEWKELHVQTFNTIEEARKFIETDLRKQFEESDDYFKDNYLKLWRI